MDRAKVICHMMTTIDGKISIDWEGNEDYGIVGAKYDALISDYGEAYGCGRNTFQYMPESDLSKFTGEKVEYKDNIIAPKVGQFLVVAFDRYGKLRRNSNIMEYGGRKSLIVEVITEQVKPEFLTYLKSLNIPYIFAGKTEFEPELFLKKIKELYKVNTFVLCGGAGINAAFLESDMIDEISLVIGAAIDGNHDGLTFVGAEKPKTFPKFFHFKELERVGEDGIILRYTKD